MTAALFDRIRTGIDRANTLASTPAIFLDVNATEATDVAAGTVTRSGGETVTVTAFPPGIADRRSIAAGYAAEGQQMLIVRAAALVRSGGATFEPAIGGRVTVHGATWIIERVSSVRDEAGVAVVFFCALRA
jgi:hypothetical protein